MYQRFLIALHCIFVGQHKLLAICLSFSSIFVFADDVAVETAVSSSSEVLDSSGLNFIHSILSASLIVQLVFLILIVMSVVSWAIILQKYFFFKEVKVSNKAMDDAFLTDGSFEEIYSKARTNENSSLSQIFIEGYNEMQKILKHRSSSNVESVKTLKGLDNIERALRKSSDTELSLMENGLGFLATVGSSCPFIGLFGTVFGIMNSFSEIAVMGSVSLHVVAPGIAEALLATGVGLFAAIPASIFYNSYLTQIKKFDLLFNNFSADFLNIAKRNFFQDKE